MGADTFFNRAAPPDNIVCSIISSQSVSHAGTGNKEDYCTCQLFVLRYVVQHLRVEHLPVVIVHRRTYAQADRFFILQQSISPSKIQEQN
jgi:hypothetical protein